jgi:hypothetical protein
LNYHWAFVPGFSHIVKPLTQLLKKNTKFVWTETCTKALDRIITVTVPHRPSLPTSVLGFCCGATCLLTFFYDCNQYDRGVGMNRFDNVLFFVWVDLSSCMIARQSQA